MGRRGSVRPGLADWLFLAPTVLFSLIVLAAGHEARVGTALFLRRTLLWPFHPALEVRRAPADLGREITDLRRRLTAESLEWSTFEETLRENGRLRGLLDFREREASPLAAAQVVGRSLDRFGETWLLSLGGQTLGRAGQTVVGVDGLVGCVYAADGGLCHVRTLRNGALQVSAMLAGSRQAGMLNWQPLSRRLLLTGIPTHVAVQPKEQVITSGFGGIFPKGIPIGEVLSAGNDSTALVKRVIVRPYTDFTETEEVFLVGD